MSVEKVNGSDARLSELISSVMHFCSERDWDQFHDPKEMSIGLITEAAELLEIFRFQSQEQMKALLENPESRTDIADELADVLFFILRFSGRTGINLTEALQAKLVKSGLKYPVEKARGKNTKYDKL